MSSTINESQNIQKKNKDKIDQLRETFKQMRRTKMIVDEMKHFPNITN